VINRVRNQKSRRGGDRRGSIRRKKREKEKTCKVEKVEKKEETKAGGVRGVLEGSSKRPGKKNRQKKKEGGKLEKKGGLWWRKETKKRKKNKEKRPSNPKQWGGRGIICQNAKGTRAKTEKKKEGRDFTFKVKTPQFKKTRLKKGDTWH